MGREFKTKDHVQMDLEGNYIEDEPIRQRYQYEKQNGLPNLTKDELIERIEWAKMQDWVNGEEMGDGSHGRTLEILLGVPENNFAIPDLGEFELKSSLMDADTPVTLFSKVPARVGDISLSDFIQSYGYWDMKRERQALYCTVSGNEINGLGWQMIINHNDNQIEFMHQGQRVAYQEISSLQEILSNKVKNLALVIAERMLLNGVKRFRYSKAYLLTGADSDLLVNLIAQGVITFDWRMHLKSSGTARDHGSAYRIKEKNLPLLYEKKERLL